MQKPFLAACRGQATSYTPIWLNRQAGRYMPEYHQVKGDTPSLDFFKNPDLAAQATLDAQRILGVDAAIMFADLLPILEPMGLSLDYIPGQGPVFANPIRNAADVTALVVEPAEQATPYIAQTVKNIAGELPAHVALIGFAGAPFTLASYAIEGKGSRNYVFVKQMMYQAPETWHSLMDKLVEQVASYVLLQISSGAEAMQLFDTWVGNLSVSDFATYVQPHLAKLLAQIKAHSDVPVIYFGTGNYHLLPQVATMGFDVIAFDWRTPLAQTWEALSIPAVQGNLDPIVLCADKQTVELQSSALLDSVANKPGHIFNLGHGIIPETPVDNVKHLVEFVHQYSNK